MDQEPLPQEDVAPEVDAAVEPEYEKNESEVAKIEEFEKLLKIPDWCQDVFDWMDEDAKYLAEDCIYAAEDDEHSTSTNYTYDAGNRPLSIAYGDETVGFVYDEASGGLGAKGRLTTMSDGLCAHLGNFTQASSTRVARNSTFLSRWLRRALAAASTTADAFSSRPRTR